MIDLIFIIILINQIIFTFIVVYNLISDIELKSYKVSENIIEKISILIPFRNEESNVSGCLESILSQKPPNAEILCLDDNSEDSTKELLNRNF